MQTETSEAMKNRRFIYNSFQKLFSFILTACVLCGAFSVSAQTRRAGQTKVSTAKKQNPLDPSAGWSGIVTYTKTLDDAFDSDEPVFGRVDQRRNRVQSHKTRAYKYEGRFFLDGSGASVVTNTQVTFSDEDKTKGHQVVVDSCHAFNDEHEFVDDSRFELIDKAFAEGAADGFNLRVGFLNDPTYHFSFRFPDAKGTHTLEEHTTHKGYCQPKNNEPQDRSNSDATKIDGETVQIDGQIDPKNPDVISGSKTWGGEKSGGVATFKYTVTWSFRRNAGELEIENIAFDEHPYPDFNSWKENDEGETVDSNIVRIRAKIVNYSKETKFPKIEFKETKENILLEGGETNISIAPGEQREVEYIWDTSGFAWGVGAKPLSDRTIKVVLTEKETKEKEKDIAVIPRPVILVHGLWADYTAWNGYDKFLFRAHSSAWHSYAVGADPSNGVMNTGEKGSLKQTNTIQQNADEAAKQIEFVRKKWNAWHVDVVAHSMGGIITRYYIYNRMKIVPDGKPTVEHLVMLGTPNMGSPCANLISRTIRPFGTTVNALAQLDTGYMNWFNANAGVNRKGTRFSNLVGTAVPRTCISNEFGDGVVEWSSAVWLIKDFRFVPEIHTKLTDEKYFYNFVLKRLAVSRLGNHQPDNDYKADFQSFNRAKDAGVQFVNAAFNKGENPRVNNSENPDDDAPQDFQINAGKQVSLQPKQSAEIEIPVSEAGKSGITFVAPPSVSATLTDEKGEVVGKNLANSPEAQTDFRFLPIDKPMNGVWRLKLENAGAQEASAIVSAWTSATTANPISFTIAAGKPNAAGQISLQAKLTNNDSPVTGATVKVRIKSDDDKAIESILFDDGSHGDGAANDGVYGATIEKLAGGDYSIEATADDGSVKSFAVASASIGVKNVTAKPALSGKIKK